MSEYWTGYDQGQSLARSRAANAVGGGLVSLIVALAGTAALFAALTVAAGVLALLGASAAVLIAAAGLVVLYPFAALLTLTAMIFAAWILSALIGALWHDPSPYFVFGSHWLYANPVGVGGAMLLGLVVAWLSVTRIEFRLAGKSIFYGVRHGWRIVFPAMLVALVLAHTKQSTGLTTLGLWLIPISVGGVLDFLLWEGPLSLSKRWRAE